MECSERHGRTSGCGGAERQEGVAWCSLVLRSRRCCAFALIFSATPACFFLSWFVADSLGTTHDEAEHVGGGGRARISLSRCSSPVLPRRLVRRRALMAQRIPCVTTFWNPEITVADPTLGA
jgi:hypothetical protein